MSTIEARQAGTDDWRYAIRASCVIPSLPPIGTEVTWRSHGGSGASEKHGRVVCHVPAGSDLTRYKEAYADSHDLSAVMLCGQARRTDSVLVEVLGKGQRKPRLYWPRSNVIQPVRAPSLPPMVHTAHAARQLPLIPSDPARRLAISGRWMDCAATPVTVPFETRCPAKWLFLDLETRQAWTFDGARFRLAGAPLRDEGREALAQPVDTVCGQHLRRRPRRPAAKHDE